MVSLTLYGGAGEIGGNKILVESKDSSIFLDFGMSFGTMGQYFSEFLQPRKSSSLTDFFELGLLPDIKGIYRNDYLAHMERPAEERAVDGVLLSHAHADHSHYIHFLRQDIPVYCTEASRTILRVLQETGSGTFTDFLSMCDAFTFYENKQGGLSRVTKRTPEHVHERDINVVEPGTRMSVGGFGVESVPVDHSLPGACGYIVEYDGGNLVYTGDIRFHGSNQELSRRFVERARNACPKILLCEGTRIDSEAQDTEADVRERITGYISVADGLVFVEHPIRDIDRINTMLEAARANGRQFAVNLKMAYLVRELGELCPFTLDDVRIMIPKKSWGLITKEGATPEQVLGDYAAWERGFIGMDNAITHRELQAEPDNYVVSMNMWDINQLTDIRPQNAIWIKSSCEPFDPEMELDEERKQHWLEHFGIVEFQAHASGHASGPELREMIERIAPDVVVPVHTEHPEMFGDITDARVVIPGLGERVEI